MSLYGEYIKERLGREIIETEHGFASYVICGENQNECYIIDIYTSPEFRKQGAASTLADLITEKAKELGCTILSGSVDPTTNNATDSLKVLLAYGFELVAIGNGLIWFKKEI